MPFLGVLSFAAGVLLILSAIKGTSPLTLLQQVV